MGNKLPLKSISFCVILLISFLGYGQTCTPTVSIASDAPANTICAGTSVTFTATFTGNAGTNILYQWRVNGVNQGTPISSNTFQTSNLQNGYVVNVLLTSDCTSGPVTSPDISMIG